MRFPRGKLSDGIAAELSAEIARGSVAALDYLPAESDLAARFAVSPRVVREALQHLAGKRLVELRQGRRARVRPADSGMLTEALSLAVSRGNGNGEHLLEVRRPLETEIARLAAERVRPTDLEAMQHQLLAMDRLAPRLDAGGAEAESAVPEFIVHDLEFHRLLAIASRNPVMIQLIDALSDLLRDARVRTTWSVVRNGPGMAPNRKDHWAIFEAVRARDSRTGSDLMRMHLDRVQQDLRSADGSHTTESTTTAASDRPDSA